VDSALPLGVGVVGCGAVTELFYAPALQALEEAGLIRVIALCDPDANNAAKLKEKFRSSSFAQTLSQLINSFENEEQGIDLVIIASPPSYHASQSIQAMEAGISVLCEKPMCTNSSAAEVMIKTARRKGCTLAVGMVRRFFPATQLIHHLLQEKVLGELESFHIAEGGPFSWPAKSPQVFDKKHGGGGLLIDVGVHVLDLLMWWLGMPEQVLYEDDAIGGVEANFRLQLRYGNGVSGTVRISRDCQLPNRYVFRCENGWIGWHVLDLERIELGFRGTTAILNGRVSHFQSGAFGVAVDNSTFDLKMAFFVQLKNVIGAMRDEERLLVAPEEALEGIQLIESCYQKKTLIAMPWLSSMELSFAHKLISY
jgi:predicted dehydrogenase